VDIWGVFAGVVERCGPRTAVEVQRATGLERVTYQQLCDTALGRSAWLMRQGVSAGDRCAILADNDADWCATYLGIVRIGAIVVPLDTTYSAVQVATIVSDAGVRIVFANARLVPVARAALAQLPAVWLADIRGEPVAASASEAPARAGPVARGPVASDPAVILYTSGTTADPKGVVLTHGNLLAERDAAFQVVTVSETDSVLGVLPLFHSLAQLANLLLPLAVGARVVFLETIDSTQLLRALSERQITHFCCVPPFFSLIHQRIMSEVQKGGVARRVVFRAMLALCFRLRRAGVNIGPRVFGRAHAAMGGQIRLFVTGG